MLQKISFNSSKYSLNFMKKKMSNICSNFNYFLIFADFYCFFSYFLLYFLYFYIFYLTLSSFGFGLKWRLVVVSNKSFANSHIGIIIIEARITTSHWLALSVVRLNASLNTGTTVTLRLRRSVMTKHRLNVLLLNRFLFSIDWLDLQLMLCNNCINIIV